MEFGEVVAEYASGVAGEIAGRRNDVMAEPGNPLVIYPFQQGDAGGRRVYPE